MKKSNRKSFRCFVGLDLAAIERRPTGFCILMGKRIQTKILYTDTEILDEIVNSNPVMVAIDAPLTLPKGRCCLKDDCTCRGNGHLRECDRAVRRLGIPIFALSLGPMRMQNPVGRRSIAARSSPTKQRKLFRLDFFMESPLVHYPFKMGMISPGLRRFL